MKRSLAAIALSIGLAIAPSAFAQTYPSQPIKVIVPYGPGGSDAQLRILQDDLARILGQPLVIENRPGAGGAIGAQAVQSATPDGYTLLLAATAVMTLLLNLQQTPFTAADFAPIGSLSATPLIVTARADLPYKTIDELIRYAKDNPDKVLMASGGAGTSTHIIGEVLQQVAGVKFRHVPFNGIAPAVTGMLSGNGDLVIGLPAPLVPHIRSGKFRALASSGSERSEFVPELPTLTEAGYNATENTRFGLFAPAATPKDVIAKLEKALAEAVQKPTAIEALRKTFTTASYKSAEELGKIVQEETAYWKEMFAKPAFKDVVTSK